MHFRKDVSKIKLEIENKGDSWFTAGELARKTDYSWGFVNSYLVFICNNGFLEKRKQKRVVYYRKIKSGFPEVQKYSMTGKKRKSNNTYAKIAQYLMENRDRFVSASDIVESTGVLSTTVGSFLRRKSISGELIKKKNGKRFCYKLYDGINIQASKGEVSGWVWIILKLNSEVYLTTIEVANEIMKKSEKEYVHSSISGVLKRWYYAGVLDREDHAYKVKKQYLKQKRPICS